MPDEIKTGSYRGISYEIRPRAPYPGIGWRIPAFDVLGRRTGYKESSGAFYDGCEDHPEGAYAWAEACVRKYIDERLAEDDPKEVK